MNHIEDKYREMFHNQDLPSDDFDTEDLWDDIAKDLDGKGLRSGTFKTRHLWFLLLVVGTGMFGVYYLNTEKDSIAKNTASEVLLQAGASEDVVQPEASEVPMQSELSEDLVNQSLPPWSDKGKGANTETLSLEQKKSVGMESGNQVLNKQSTSKNTKSNSPDLSSEKLIGNAIVKTEKYDLLKDQKSNTQQIIRSNSKRQGQKVQSVKPISKPSFAELALLPLKLDLIDSAYTDQLVFKLPVLPLVEDKKKKNLSWRIGLWGGFNTMSLKFQSKQLLDLATLKEQTEVGEWGLSFGASTGMLWRNRWLLSSGLEYHQLMTKFAYEKQTNIRVLKENQLLRVWLDATSMDTIDRRYGDTVVNAVSTLQVVHYNKYKKFSIPLEIGLQQDAGKLQYGTTAGLVFNFLSAQSGKTFDSQSEINIFDKQSLAAPFTNFNIGLRVSPFLNYRIKEKLVVTLTPQLNWQTNADFEETDIRVSAWQINLNVGLGYYFE